jgi:hypothetical protein
MNIDELSEVVSRAALYSEKMTITPISSYNKKNGFSIAFEDLNKNRVRFTSFDDADFFLKQLEDKEGVYLHP